MAPAVVTAKVILPARLDTALRWYRSRYSISRSIPQWVTPNDLPSVEIGGGGVGGNEPGVETRIRVDTRSSLGALSIHSKFRDETESGVTVDERIEGSNCPAAELTRFLAYRHLNAQRDLAVGERFSAAGPKTILVSGASGLVGSQLVPFLGALGHQVFVMRRPGSSSSHDGVTWNPMTGELGPCSPDIVIHLAGENIAEGRWTAERKRALVSSRVDATKKLRDFLETMEHPPKFVSASAVGIYGSRGADLCTEATTPGEGFLARLCVDWEAVAASSKLRSACVRFGVVLSPRGGALAKMLPPFKLGLGGPLGDGSQYMSWIGIDDAVRAICHAAFSEDSEGPWNVTAPSPVTNREFTETLAAAIHRPAIFKVPRFALKAAFGEMAEEALLASARVAPSRLAESGFDFATPDLALALSEILP